MGYKTKKFFHLLLVIFVIFAIYAPQAMARNVMARFADSGPGTFIDSIPEIGVYLVEESASLYSEPDLEWAEPLYVTRSYGAPTDPLFGNQWYYNKVRGDLSREISQGSPSFIMALLDSGINFNHPDLNGSGGLDLTGHGTAMAGIISGIADNGVGIAGLSKISINSYQIIGSDGRGNTFDMARAIINAVNEGNKVILISAGSRNYSYGLAAAVNFALENDSLIIAAAGNENGPLSWPAALDGVLGIGASNQSDERCTLADWGYDSDGLPMGSNYGPGLNMVAPGVNIYTTSINSDYAYINGTSASAAIVSAAAAIVWNKNPLLSADDIAGILINSCIDVGASGYDLHTGYGRLDFYNAITSLSGGSSEGGGGFIPGDGSSNPDDPYGPPYGDDPASNPSVYGFKPTAPIIKIIPERPLDSENIICQITDSSGDLDINGYIGSVDIPGSVDKILWYGSKIFVAAGSNGIFIIEGSRATSPQIKGTISTGALVRDIALSGRVLIASLDGLGLAFYNADSHEKIGEYALYPNISELSVSGTLLVGKNNNSILIFAVDNPENPVLKATINSNANITGISLRNNLLAIGENALGLRLFDISLPHLPNQIYEYAFPYPVLGVDLDEKFLFAAISGNGIRIIDISDPLNPVIKGNLNNIGNIMKVSGENGKLCAIDSYSGFKIVDYTDPENPYLADSLSLPAEGQGLSISGSLAAVTCGFMGIRIISLAQNTQLSPAWNLPGENIKAVAPSFYGPIILSDSGKIRLVKSDTSSAQWGNALNLGQSGHDLATAGNLLLASLGDSGIGMVDMKNFDSPQFLGYFSGISKSTHISVDGLNGISGDELGDIRHFSVFSQLLNSTKNFQDPINAVKLVGSVGFIGAGQRFIALSFGNPANPVVVSETELNFSIEDIEIWGSVAWVSGGLSGLVAIDLKDISEPVILSGFDSCSAYKMISGHDRLFFTDNSGDIKVLGIWDPENPTILDSFQLNNAQAIKKSGDLILVGTNTGINSLKRSNDSLLYDFVWSSDSGAGFVERPDLSVYGTKDLTSTVSSSWTSPGQKLSCTVRAWDGAYYSSPATAQISVNTPPAITNLAISGISKNISLIFTLSDLDQDPVNLTVAFKGGSVGNNWISASTNGVLTGIVPGPGRSITWRSGVDQFGIDSSDYYIRLTPSDREVGQSGIYGPFRVDNRSPKLISVLLVDGGNYGAGEGDQVQFVFDEAISPSSITEILNDGISNNNFAAGSGNLMGSFTRLMAEIGNPTKAGNVQATESKMTLSPDSRIVIITLGGEISGEDGPSGNFVPGPEIRDLSGNSAAGDLAIIKGSFGEPAPEDVWHSSSSSIIPNILQPDNKPIYDPTSNYLSTMPTARRYMASVYYQDFIYFFGGVDNGGSLKSTLKFNTITGNFEEMANMPAPRRGLAAALLDGKAYLIGGGDPDDFSKLVYIYDIEDNSFSQGQNMIVGRRGHTAAAIDGKIFVLGGLTESGVTNSVEVFDPKENSWQLVESMTTARFSHSTATDGEYIYSLGGYDGNAIVASGEKYDPEKNIWTTIPSLPVGRYGAIAASLGSEILVIGGFNMEALGRVDSFDKKKGVWTTRTPMPAPRYYGAGSAVDHGEKAGTIFIAGGSSSANLSKDIHSYVPRAVYGAFSQPAHFSVVAGKIDIMGTIKVAYGELGSASLQYALNDNHDVWTALNYPTHEISLGKLGEWNSNDESTAEVEFRLRLNDKLGHSADIRLKCLLDNTGIAISSPENKSSVFGNVPIIGTVGGLRFDRWELSFGQGATPEIWHQISSGTQAIENNTIEVWNTEGYTGTHTLKLAVHRKSGEIIEKTREVKIANKPTGQIIAPGENEIITTVPYLFKAEGTDLSGTGLKEVQFWVKRSGNWAKLFTDTQEAWEYSWDLEGIGNETVEVGVYVMDRALNVSNLISVKDVVIKVAPTVEIVGLSAGDIIWDSSVELRAIVEDRSGKGIEKVQYSAWTGGAWRDIGIATEENFILNWDILDISNQEIKIRARATDKSGRIGDWEMVEGLVISKETNLPQGSLISPSAPQVLRGGKLELVAQASDDSGVKWVQFKAYYNGAWSDLYKATEEPYGYEWDYSQIKDQNDIRFAITVKDIMGNLAIAPDGYHGGYSINKKPEVSFITPLSNTIFQNTDIPVKISVTDHSEIGIEWIRVKGFFDKSTKEIITLHSEPWEFTWDMKDISNQNKINLVVDIADKAGKITNKVAQVSNLVLSRETTPPTGELLSPIEGQIIDTMTTALLANASDTSGIAKVEFHAYYDGKWNFIGQKDSAPYQMEWDTSGILDQSGIMVYALAVDKVGNTAKLPNSYAKDIALSRFEQRTIEWPTDGQVVGGEIKILGKAQGSGFASYTLEYGMGHDPQGWNNIKTSTTPKDGILGTLDASNIVGAFALRLRVYDSEKTYEKVVRLMGAASIRHGIVARNSKVDATIANISDAMGFFTLEYRNALGELVAIDTVSLNSGEIVKSSSLFGNLSALSSIGRLTVISDKASSVMMNNNANNRTGAYPALNQHDAFALEYSFPVWGLKQADILISGLERTGVDIAIRSADGQQLWSAQEIIEKDNILSVRDLFGGNFKSLGNILSVHVKSEKPTMAVAYKWNEAFGMAYEGLAYGQGTNFSVPLIGFNNARVELVNNQDKAVSVTIEYYDNNGKKISGANGNIPPYGMLNSNQVAGNPYSKGNSVLVKISADSPIYAYGAAWSANAGSMISLLPDDKHSTSWAMPVKSGPNAPVWLWNITDDTALVDLEIMDGQKSETIVVSRPLMPRSGINLRPTIEEIGFKEKDIILRAKGNQRIKMIDLSQKPALNFTWSDQVVDTDGDALPDWWEKLFGLDWEDPSDGESYFNPGGLNAFEEYKHGTNPHVTDTDGDGISDYDEINLYGTDPLRADTDNDGISDYDEINLYGTDPLRADTDNDGISDYDELMIHGTDPLRADTDNDGIDDLIEVKLGYDPTDATEKPFGYTATVRRLDKSFLIIFNPNSENNTIIIQSKNEAGKMIYEKQHNIPPYGQIVSEELKKAISSSPLSPIRVYATKSVNCRIESIGGDKGASSQLYPDPIGQGREFWTLAGYGNAQHIMLSNTSPFEREISVELFDGSGNILKAINETVAPNSTWTSNSGLTTNLTKNANPAIIRVRSDESISAQLNSWNGTTNWGTQLNNIESFGKEYNIGMTAFNTGVVGLVNPGPNSASLEVLLIDSEGKEKKSMKRVLPPRGGVIVNDEMGNILAIDKSVMVKIKSDNNIGVVAWKKQGDRTVGSTVLPNEYSSQSQLSGTFRNVGQNSIITLSNPSENPLDLNVRIFDDKGAELSSSTVNIGAFATSDTRNFVSGEIKGKSIIIQSQGSAKFNGWLDVKWANFAVGTAIF